MSWCERKRDSSVDCWRVPGFGFALMELLDTESTVSNFTLRGFGSTGSRRLLEEVEECLSYTHRVQAIVGFTIRFEHEGF